jgi:hypothetical protein
MADQQPARSPGKPGGWKVEGAREPQPAASGPRRRWRLPFGAWFWVAVLVALVANQIIFSRVSQPPGRLSISTPTS